MKKIALHICCSPCASGVLDKLKNEEYEIFGIFYNPNIYPEEEYQRRLKAMEKMAKIVGLSIFIGPYEVEKWEEEIRGLEDEPENGRRCEICYKMRLQYTAIMAKKLEYDYFTTTLTVSPHKSAKIINEIGKKVGERHGIKFIEYDFKKQDGFKKSITLSKKYELYRQKYCGCRYSL